MDDHDLRPGPAALRDLIGGRAATLSAAPFRRLILGALLATGCASAPSGPPGEQPAAQARTPTVLNVNVFRQTLAREYPATLRQAGIDGEAVVWLRVSEEGRVQEQRIHTTSGSAVLDRHILRVARVLRFDPGAETEPFWVKINLGHKLR